MHCTYYEKTRCDCMVTSIQRQQQRQQLPLRTLCWSCRLGGCPRHGESGTATHWPTPLGLAPPLPTPTCPPSRLKHTRTGRKLIRTQSPTRCLDCNHHVSRVRRRPWRTPHTNATTAAWDSENHRTLVPGQQVRRGCQGRRLPCQLLVTVSVNDRIQQAVSRRHLQISTGMTVT